MNKPQTTLLNPHFQSPSNFTLTPHLQPHLSLSLHHWSHQHQHRNCTNVHHQGLFLSPIPTPNHAHAHETGACPTSTVAAVQPTQPSHWWSRPILAKEMYAKKACELVKEFSSSESGQLSSFNSDVFAQVIEECNTHFSQLQFLLSKMQEEGLDNQTARNADHFGALIHHLSLVRNKRCLMAYVYNRAEVIRSLGWIKEAPLPEEIQEKLSSSEKDYSQNHSATIKSYQLEMDIDLAVDMVPPKDPYIKVRVLEDIGSVALSDQIANLARHAILFLRRTDAETYISQGLMEELTD